ncbi:TetR family transcriptional regulator [Sphingobacterium sp. E70]|uniref:TetR family transcriptional regulator n=1 Tax=Sphingobacterium sp. E70 TaxID=2853439 RepID=UPI00211C6EE9|nr:TetR family transcriptional regulator [Sphingobacterium sp. E70]ULT25042.1 TetR family transcriptional regulator [Sphingobacterium sp. E70]
MLTKAEKTKQFILETASPLYNEKGISGVSIDDVLEATKLTKGCLYGHFNGKEDLSEQVVDYSQKKITERVASVVSKVKQRETRSFYILIFIRTQSIHISQEAVPSLTPLLRLMIIFLR